MADSADQLLVIAQAVSASGRSVLQLIEDIDKQFPGVKDRICEADGKVRRFVNIFVNRGRHPNLGESADADFRER